MTRVSGPLQGGYQQAIERLFNEGTVSGLSEAQLLERFALRNDEAAFAALVQRHGPMVLGVCRRFLRDPNDVDDAFQAVFLVLVRRAGDIRRKELLGNWLYGVACRVSIRARSLAARRPATITEADGDKLRANDPAPVESRSWLHEEVERLPRRYRQPVVACYFEGRTHEEAATLLGCPLGTVKGRLSRARDLLRKRLERRGLTVPAVALAAQLASHDLRAAVPVPLAHGTVRSGLALTAAGASLMTTSAISTSVRILTKGALHAMLVTQIKALALPLIVAAAGVLTAGATVAARQAADGKPEAKQPVVAPALPKAEQPKAPPDESELAADAIPDSDIKFFHLIGGPVGDYTQSQGRLLSDLSGAATDEDKENARTLHRARVGALVRKFERQEPVSQAGRDLKSALLTFFDKDLDWQPNLQEQISRSPHFTGFGGSRQGFGGLDQAYEASLRRLNEDLKAASTPEEKKAARDLHQARLEAMARVAGVVEQQQPGFEARKSLQEFVTAYLAFRQKLDVDPAHPRSIPHHGPADPKNAPAAKPAPAVAKADPPKPEPDKPDAKANPPKAEPKPVPTVAAGGGGFGMGGGGFGVGGMSGTSGPSPDEVRQKIAELSATLAHFDESPKNKAVLEALDKVITLRTTDKSTLGDMLKQIKESVHVGDGKKVPIYVDPNGLEEAGASLGAPVSIDLEDVPIKFSLRLMLKQIGLAYCVRDGVVVISSLEGVQQELKEAESELMGMHPDQVIYVNGQRRFSNGSLQQPGGFR